MEPPCDANVCRKTLPPAQAVGQGAIKMQFFDAPQRLAFGLAQHERHWGIRGGKVAG
jgi:hypothetical protein